MNKLLSDKELREQFKKLHQEYQSRLDDNVIDDGKTAWVWYYDELARLIQSQKQAHGEMVSQDMDDMARFIAALLTQFGGSITVAKKTLVDNPIPSKVTFQQYVNLDGSITMKIEQRERNKL